MDSHHRRAAFQTAALLLSYRPMKSLRPKSRRRRARIPTVSPPQSRHRAESAKPSPRPRVDLTHNTSLVSMNTLHFCTMRTAYPSARPAHHRSSQPKPAQAAKQVHRPSHARSEDRTCCRKTPLHIVEHRKGIVCNTLSQIQGWSGVARHPLRGSASAEWTFPVQIGLNSLESALKVATRPPNTCSFPRARVLTL